MMKFTSAKYWLYALLFLIMGCTQRNTEDTTTEQQIDTVANSSEPIGKESPSTDAFYQAVDKFSKDFPNYKSVSVQLVDTLNDLSNHWLLMTLERHRKRLGQSDAALSANQSRKLPTLMELEMINSIRQGAFYLSSPKSNDVVFEEWNFDNQKNADRWLVLMRDSLRRNEYTKPPRYQWTEGSKLYLVSTRSAGQWFEFSDSLIVRLSGKTKAQMNHLYDPMNLPHFKKWQGPSNSSVLNIEPYLFKQSTGPHYSYFYFVKQRLRGEARAKANSEFLSKQEFSITTSLHKPLTGDEQFNSIAETLVAIQCSINEPALNSLDIVGKNIDDLQELFGSTLLEKENLSVFGHSNRIVVAKMDQDKVSAFKYLRLKESFETLLVNEDMINSILSFE